MLKNWLERRRIAKHSRAFWNLLTQGDTQAALGLYRRELEPAGLAVGREVRVAFHVHRWLVELGGTDARAVRSMAGESPPESAVGFAWRVLRQLHGQARLALALAKAEPDGTVTANWSSAEGAIPEAEAMESLGLAVLEARAMPGSAPTDRREALARSVLGRISAAPESSFCRRVRGHLLAWSCQVLGEPGRILADRSAIEALDGPTARRVLLAAGLALAKAELAKGNCDAALSALSQVESLAEGDVRRAIVLDCGRFALSHAPEAAAKWFSHHWQKEETASWKATFILGAALGRILCSQYAEAREALGKALETVSRHPSTPGLETDTCRRILSQALYLSALSRVSTTEDWAIPVSDRGQAEAVARQQGFVKNRSLWNDLRRHMDPVVRDLAGGDPESAWLGNLLAGLVAYVDGSFPLDLAGIERFSEAVGRVESVNARTRLKEFEGTLVARARATEQAMDLIQRKKIGHLRQLKDTILNEMGDAIPPLVRAAVYMTLWPADPKYDPLPDLKRIPVQASDETLIGECIALVQLGGILAQLCRMCLGQAGPSEVVPPMEPIAAFDPFILQRASLAGALIHLRQGNLQAARTLLDGAGEQTDPAEAAYARFYLAWKEGDSLACRALADGENCQRIRQQPGWSSALTVMTLLNALEADRDQQVWDSLMEIAGGPESAGSKDLIGRLVAWLLQERRAGLARALLRIVGGRESAGSAPSSPQAQSLKWMCQMLSASVAAQMGQYTVCMDTVERLLSVSPPAEPAFGAFEADRRMIAWARLLRVEAELGVTAGLSQDPKVRWHSLQRTLEDHKSCLIENPGTRPYAFLLAGLCTHLSADTVVDEETIARLGEAQQALSLRTHGPFLQQAAGRLVWRKRVLEDFWQSISVQNLKRARLIYQEELLPAFGVRMPHSIQLGMVIVDWDVNAATTEVLLERLETFRHEAPDLNPELIDKTRDYILESDKIRRLTTLLKTQRFEELVEQIDRLTWLALEPGAMPLPVAIARLYACLKLRNAQEATAMGTQISEARNYAGWVTDDGSLLLGYVLFDQQKYPDAAKAFEKIGSSSLLGHDVDKYWAASQFNHGLQLLKVNQKEKAFEAFGRSLGKAADSQGAGNLAPLFVHFALQGLDARNGDQARQAFVLMSKSLEGLPESAQKQASEATAQMGQLLCRAKMEEDVRDLGGGKFISLWERLETEGSGKDLDAKARTALERSLRILGVCQELLRQARLPGEERLRRSDLTTFLRAQITSLETLQKRLNQEDPVLLVLKGLVDLLLAKGKASDALNSLEQAFRLGVHSPRLAALLERERELVRKAMERNEKALDLFDLYLDSGAIPSDLRGRLVRDDDLAHLYRIGRSYLPGDVVADDITSGGKLLCDRLENLRKFISSDSLQEDREFAILAKTIGGLIETLRKTEQQLLEEERKTMQHLAAVLRAQSVEPV